MSTDTTEKGLETLIVAAMTGGSEPHSTLDDEAGESAPASGGDCWLLGGAADYDREEDRINRIMEARKLLPNASYFAFTATPKNKTLEPRPRHPIEG